MTPPQPPKHLPPAFTDEVDGFVAYHDACVEGLPSLHAERSGKPRPDASTDAEPPAFVDEVDEVLFFHDHDIGNPTEPGAQANGLAAPDAQTAAKTSPE